MPRNVHYTHFKVKDNVLHMHNESAFGSLVRDCGMGHQAHMPKVASKSRVRAPHYMRAWRKMRGMTLESLGECVGMSSQNLGRIERGETAYTQDTLEAVADALGCSAADILARDPRTTESHAKHHPGPANGNIPPEVAESVLQWVFLRLDLPEHEAFELARASVVVMRKTAEAEASRETSDVVRARVETALDMIPSKLQ